MIVSAKKLAYSFYCPNIFLLYDIPTRPTRYMTKGEYIHNKYKFNNTRKYIGIFKLKDRYVEIYGVPDKVEKYVYELKTGNPFRLKIYRVPHLYQLKIYTKLTNKPGILLEYDTEANRFIYSRRVEIPDDKEWRMILQHAVYMSKLDGLVKEHFDSPKCRYCIFRNICGNSQLTSFIS